MENTRAALSRHRGMFVIVIALALALVLSGHDVARRTADRYTGTQAAADWARQAEVDREQNSRIDQIQDAVYRWWSGPR